MIKANSCIHFYDVSFGCPKECAWYGIFVWSLVHPPVVPVLQIQRVVSREQEIGVNISPFLHATFFIGNYYINHRKACVRSPATLSLFDTAMNLEKYIKSDSNPSSPISIHPILVSS